MKKTIAFLLALALAAALCACKKRPAETSDSTPSGTVGTEPTAPAASDTSATTEVPAVRDYDIVQRTEKSAALDAAYGILALGDAKTDAALEAYADEMFASYVPNASSLADEGGSATYAAQLAEIYTDEKLVSASFVGMYTITNEDGRETRGEVYYTVNVDRASGRLLSGGDIVTDFDALAAALTGGSFKPGALRADDLAQYRPEYDMYPYFRFDKENFYVGINFPGVTETNAEYAISRADAADFLAEAYR